jgi:CRISPR-associated endoribonuclease Cas6
MLIRAAWLLTVDEPILLPRTYGLALVQELHAKMNLKMGDASVPNISCSSLMGNIRIVEDFVEFDPSITYQLVICGLNTTATNAITNLDLTDALALLGAKFHVQRQPDEVSSYQELYHDSIVLEPTPIDRYTLNFLTPTAFSQNRKYLPLPLPQLMFHSWLERWNHFAPVYLGGEELITYLDDATALTQLRIQTRNVTIHRGKIPGFTGVINLRISSIDPLLANVANLLLKYAPFSGTGIKTRLGMGVTTTAEFKSSRLTSEDRSN